MTALLSAFPISLLRPPTEQGSDFEGFGFTPERRARYLNQHRRHLIRFGIAKGQATAMQPARGVVSSPVVVHARLPVHCRALRCDHHMIPALPATHLQPIMALYALHTDHGQVRLHIHRCSPSQSPRKCSPSNRKWLKVAQGPCRQGLPGASRQGGVLTKMQPSTELDSCRRACCTGSDLLGILLCSRVVPYQA